ncbi:MAG: hypothetical protein LBI54_03440 [Lachnospiraceae bacterium]|jgi:hypothetical protein|nr:hypothetical protein [Lachnospiraceae bacterium]
MKESRFITAVYHEKRLAAIFAVLFALSLLPLFILAFYNYPGVDDFANGLPTKAAYTATGSLAAVLVAAARFAGEVYYTWQGSYFAQLLFSLHPAFFWGEGLYALTTFLMLFMLIGATVFLLRAVLVQGLGLGGKYVVLVGVPVLYFSIEALPFPVEGFYWYTGSVYYMFFYGLMLLLLGLCLGLYNTPAGRPPARFWLKAVLAALLCLAIGGGNLVTGLVTALLLAGLAVACFARRRPPGAKLALTLLFLLLLAAFLVNVMAPGNAVRDEYVGFGGRGRAVTAILFSLYVAGYNILEWLDLRLASLLVFLTPVFWRLTGETAYAFKRPWLAALASYLLYAAGFAPSLYATGNMGQGRVRNIIFCSLVLLVFLNYIYLLGWLRRRLEARPPAGGKAALAQDISRAGPYVAAAFAAVFLLASAFHLKEHNSYTAAAYLLDGTARQYAAEMKERYRILHDDSIKQVHFPPLSLYPDLLFLRVEGDLSPDKDNWKNQDMAQFYQKEYVVLDGGQYE